MFIGIVFVIGNPFDVKGDAILNELTRLKINNGYTFEVITQ